MRLLDQTTEIALIGSVQRAIEAHGDVTLGGVETISGDATLRKCLVNDFEKNT